MSEPRLAALETVYGWRDVPDALGFVVCIARVARVVCVAIVVACDGVSMSGGAMLVTCCAVRCNVCVCALVCM